MTMLRSGVRCPWRRSRWLSALGLLALACSSPGSRAEGAKEGAGKPPELSPVTEGLQDAHRATNPLLEKVACIPPRERPGAPQCHSMRVYQDGSTYLLAAPTGGTARWAFLSRLRPEGVTELEELLVSVCGDVDPVQGNDQGSFIYRVFSPRCTRELLVTGVPEGPLTRLAGVETILSRHMEKIQPSPRP